MKFNFCLKAIVLIVLVSTMEMTEVKDRSSSSNLLTNRYKNSMKLKAKTTVRDPEEELKVMANSANFRFIDNDKMNKIKEKNLLMLNSEVLNAKPPADKDEEETQVSPKRANAGSEFMWKFLWWTVMHFPAKNALRPDSSYWLSRRGVVHDHWEVEFQTPQKIDLIHINWRLPPKRFRVFIKLDDKSEYLPVTEVFEKTQHINKQGKVSSKDAISQYNAIVFHKPVFAKRVRINLNEPVKKRSFSITWVKFFQKKTTMLLKNELYDDSQHYCMYVNTNRPTNGSKIDVYPCLKALTQANNNELWIYNNDSSIRHYNSKMCLGFDVQNNIVLRQCGDYNPAFTVRLRNDSTLYFNGYPEKCIVIDETKKISDSFVDESTELYVTTEADRQTFKKENMKFTGENYWHSVPGAKKVSIQILFGKITKGPNKGKFENKKVDLIKIDWIKQPKKFMVYTWKPGYSWNLRYVFDNYKSKTSEIEIIGEDAAAIMLVLQESELYEELGNLPAYAIREISITYNSIAVKNANCSDYAKKLKIFDFDNQYYRKLEQVKDYTQVRQKLSVSFEKMIAGYNNIKNRIKYISKAKIKALDLTNKLVKLKKAISDGSIKKLREFKSNILSTIKNSVFQGFIHSKNVKNFMGQVTHQNTSIPKLGTKENPAVDCLSIKKLQKNSLSGFYYISRECMPKPLRVYCDFTIFGDAVDVYVFNDDSREPNPDLTYLGIKDFNSVRFQCAKQGLMPIQINNRQTVKRIHQILVSMGYDLSKAIAVPLGYDYTCGKGKCSGIVNSLNDKQSPVISSFFKQEGKKNKGVPVKPGPFVGLGYSNTYSMIKFDSANIQISALICSTNHFKSDSTDRQVKTLSCDLTPSNNGDIFKAGGNILVECPVSCHDSKTPIYGTNVYHFKSSVCRAAIHAGVLTTKGGKVNVRVSKGLPKYAGSSANGINSEDIEKGDGMNSFALIKHTPSCPISQFKELAKEEAKMQMEENKSEDDSSEGTSDQTSAFIQTEMKTEMMMTQAREAFERDLESNELEGVELDDIHSAGLKTNNPQADLYKPDNDEENYQYNQSHSDDNNSINDQVESGTVNESTTDVPSLTDFNNDNNFASSADSEGPSVSDNFKFNQVEAEKVSSHSLSEAEIQSELESLNQNESLTENEVDLQSETYMYTHNNPSGGNQKRDRLESQDPNKQTNDASNKILDDITKASNDVMTQNNINTNDNKNQKGIPTPRPDSLPKAPRKGQTQPDLEDDKKQTDNKKNEPTTDEGNKIVKKIRKVVDENYITIVKKKLVNIKQTIDAYNKSFAWSKDGSKLSLPFIKKHLLMLEKYKTKLLFILKKLSDEAQARVMMTKKVKRDWWDELNQLESKEIFTLNYAIPADILLKKVMLTLDTKSKVKSNWDIHKEKIKGRAQAVGITSKIKSKNQVWGSMLKVNGREYYDLNLKVDILMKSKGVAGVAFRMRDEFNFYAFIVDKNRGVKSLVVVKNGRARTIQEIKDGGILLDNWHRIQIKTKAGNLKIHVYDIEQSKKTNSEKIIEVIDGTFSSGGVGIFVNGMQGFFFDALTISPAKCWTPWTPMRETHIVTPTCNVYYEDFSGSIPEKFIKDDPEEATDGPAEWKLNQFSTSTEPAGLYQTSLTYDKSSSRRPSMILRKEKIISNGTITVYFIPYSEEGIISIIFKYHKGVDSSGQTNEMFYSFDMISDQKKSQFELRKMINGILTVMKTVNTPVKDLPTLGFKASVLNKVEISIIGDKIVIKVSNDGSPLIEVINMVDTSIPHGMIGVGTFRAKAAFTAIDMFPPRLHMTESENHKVLSHDNERIYFPEVPGRKSSKDKDKRKNKGKSDKNGKSEGGEVEGLGSGGKKESGAGVGWKVCVTTTTTKERELYCAREFPLPQTKTKCVNNFCDKCCDANVEKTHKNSLYMCKKSCSRSSSAEGTVDEYKNVCIRSENPISNVYDYCENKLKDQPDQKKVCKIDMCNLCCTTMDMMKNKNFSMDSMKKCFEDCSKEFNK